jgi:hypothetical protein
MSIVGQAVANEQVRSGHQAGVDSGNVNPLYIEQYGGEVEHRILKESFMRQFFKFKTIRGTDTLTNDRIGSSALQKVARGIRPVDHGVTFDNISIKIDTIVLARTNEFVLDAFLSHIDTRKEIGVEHGREIGKFFDESFLVQGIKACQVTNVDPDGVALGGWEGLAPANIVRTAPKGFQGGTPVVLSGVGDELDPDLLELAIQDMCQKIEEKDIDVSEAVLLMRPAQYYALLRNQKLISRDFSSVNGDYAKGDVLESCGVRIQKTNRFPKASDVGVTHFLSNAGNGNAYDVSANDAKCVVCLLMPKALLAGETIPLTSDVYFDKKEMQWFIDSYLSFAVTPNRAEMAAGIFSSTVA